MRGSCSTLLIVCALVAAVPARAADPGTGGAAPQTGPVTLITAPQGFVNRSKLFSGNAGERNAAEVVVVERYDELAGVWTALTRAIVTEDGNFSARWKADRPGPARIRARVEGDATPTAELGEIAITIYRPHKTTYFGPGFYGNKTACGQTLDEELLGVAHRTVACGTLVEFFYRGRTLTVPVVDRGPYAKGYVWDLTSAAAEQLGLTTSGVVGSLRPSDLTQRRR